MEIVSDLSGYFPLSNKPRRDESAVTSNWAPARAATLRELTRIIDGADLNTPALLSGWTVGELAADVVLSAREGRPGNPVAVVRQALRSPSARSRERLAAARAYLAAGGAVARDIRQLADADNTDAAAPVSATTLGDALVATLDAARSLDRPVVIDPVAAGAVALARSLSGPPGARAVARDQLLVAVDGDWQVGRGRRREASAQEIVLFLYGRGWTEPLGG